MAFFSPQYQICKLIRNPSPCPCPSKSASSAHRKLKKANHFFASHSSSPKLWFSQNSPDTKTIISSHPLKFASRQRFQAYLQKLPAISPKKTGAREMAPSNLQIFSKHRPTPKNTSPTGHPTKKGKSARNSNHSGTRHHQLHWHHTNPGDIHHINFDFWLCLFALV